MKKSNNKASTGKAVLDIVKTVIDNIPTTVPKTKYPIGLPPKETHGPVVKTGPTAGQNRSRNKNGRFRKVRSDKGKKR